MASNECFDVLYYGNCTKKEHCQVCSKLKKTILNINSAEYVPKKKQTEQKPINPTINNQPSLMPEKLDLNLEAKEYHPKINNNNSGNNSNSGNNFIIRQDQDDEMFDDEDITNKEVEVIVNDIIENEEIEDDDESDEEKWFPKFKDCDCCQGFIYKCNGKACENLQYCYCKVKTECDDFN